jgi:hypothetical protein
VSYTVSVSGCYLFEFKMGSQRLLGAAGPVAITASDDSEHAQPEKCRAEGTGHLRVYAGLPAVFTVVPCNKGGYELHPSMVSGLTFNVSLGYTDPATGAVMPLPGGTADGTVDPTAPLDETAGKSERTAVGPHRCACLSCRP